MKHWKRILVFVLLVAFLLSFLVKGTEGTTGSGQFVHYQFGFPGKKGYRFTMTLPNTLESTPSDQTVTSPTGGDLVKRPYRIKGHYTYFFSKNSSWVEAWEHPYFEFNITGGTHFTYYYPDSIPQNDYPGSYKSGEGNFIIPANQYATVTYNAGYYISRFAGVLWITNRWGVSGGCTIEYFLDSEGPNAPKTLWFDTVNTTNVKKIGNTYYSQGKATLLWDTPDDNPVNADLNLDNVYYEKSGIQGYEIYDNETKLIPPDNKKYFEGNSVDLILTGDGLHTIKIIAFDNENNSSLPNTIDIKVDHTPPPLSASDIQINDNSEFTNAIDAKVTVSLNNLGDANNGSGIDLVCISNDDVNYTPYQCEPLQTKMPISGWELASPLVDGEKIIYVKLTDKLGNTSNPITKKIILDRTAPDGYILINGGASTTYAQDVTLTLAATDAYSGITTMKIFNDSNTANYSSSPYKTEYPWTLSDNNEAGTNKEKTVYVKFTDGAGNESEEVIADSIIYEDQPHFTDPTLVRVLTDNETWSGVTEISGQVEVPPGKTLVILSDAMVTFDNEPGKNSNPDLNGLIIRGRLEVRSGAILTKTTQVTGWMGIIIYGTAEIIGANISYAKRGVAVLNDAIDEEVYINSCNFSRNYIGVHAHDSAPRINNCTFQSNTYGIKEDDGGAPVVNGCGYTGNKIDYYDDILTKIEQD
ncbi:MAG TPA: hypothetical protein VHY08_07065 [Bacillota bacterium]|nr:hypothetical protein [Bacillota bacterium]